MNFLLYYILRRFFVKLELTEKEIRLEKGLLIKRLCSVKFSDVLRFSSRRTLLMRVFRAREITLYTLGGSVRFFLKKDEPLFENHCPNSFKPHFLKPRFREIAFGAFIDTRALGGIFLFAAVLRKLSIIFGGVYLDRVIDALNGATRELERLLRFLKIAVPRAAVTLAVFALGAWIFAYLRKLIRLSRFRVSISSDRVYVQSGLITLYEHKLVRNTAELRDSLVSLAARRAPLYLSGVMIMPCVKSSSKSGVLRRLFGELNTRDILKSSKRAFFGHIAAPLTRCGIFAALFIPAYVFDRSVRLLRTLLWCGAAVNLYAAALYLLYMYRSEIRAGEVISVTTRRGLRLVTAAFPRDFIKLISVKQSPFQKRRGLCNIKLSLIEKRRLTVRQLSFSPTELPKGA